MSLDHPGDDPRFGLGYALAAYALFLVAFFVYVAWIHWRCARLRARLEEAERRIEQATRSRP